MVFSGGFAHGLVIQYPLSGPGTARRLPFIKRFLAAKKELSHLLPLGKMDTSPISSFIADLFYHRLFYRQLQSDQYHPSLGAPAFSDGYHQRSLDLLVQRQPGSTLPGL